MPEVRFALKPAAEKAITEKKDELMRYRKAGLLTTKQVWKEFVAFLERMIYDARMDAADRTLIHLACPTCGRTHTMPADVTHYRCVCDPHRDRETWKHRIPIPEGGSHG